MDNTYLIEKLNVKTGESIRIQKKFTDTEMENIRQIAIDVDDTMERVYGKAENRL